MSNDQDDKKDGLAAAIQKLLPKSLDDIIRLHRDEVELRLTSEEEIMALYDSIEPAQPLEIMDEWRFITLHVIPIGESQVMLMGYRRSNEYFRVTSIVRQIDLDRGFVITNSGSLYQLGTAGQGEPPLDHLMGICVVLHKWGFGMRLGVPLFYC